jgi:hypothetical protein
MRPLIQAAARLAQVDFGSFAIIGGIAVTARLGRAHRATADLDTVVDDDTPPPALDVLRGLDGATPDPIEPHRVYLDGTKVEEPERSRKPTWKTSTTSRSSSSPVTDGPSRPPRR